ncbi:MAG: hypothetical protein ACI92E_001917, partial [Oceanicoccus sp.]
EQNLQTLCQSIRLLELAGVTRDVCCINRFLEFFSTIMGGLKGGFALRWCDAGAVQCTKVMHFSHDIATNTFDSTWVINSNTILST